jgi:hypothetical protein
MRRVSFWLSAVAAVVLFAPATARAQVGIAGAVKDSTGAALPGVSVEASSPALIEKSRTVVTDGAGQYRILDLSPGVYTVVFSLQGFKLVRRTDIILEGTLTAQVNAEMEVGSLEESITVTGASPVVDVVNNRQSFVANREVLDSIPTASRNLPSRAAMIPGTSVSFLTLGQYNMTIHGSVASDMTIAVDGMRLNNLCGSGQFSGFYLNDAAAQEITYLTGAGSAEVGSGGLRINVIPKDGGNTFSGTMFGYGSSGPLQSDNRTDAMKAANAFSAPGIDYDYMLNPSFGGPIMRDKLWFYFTYRFNDYVRYASGAQFADGSPIPISDMGNYSAVSRVTWQATSRDKFRVYVDRQFNGEIYNNANATTSPEATHNAEGGGWTPQIKWSQTTTNRILLEAGYTLYDQPYSNTYNDAVGPLDLPHFDQSTGRLTVAGTNPYTSFTKNNGVLASMAYVTGSHSIKTGMTLGWGINGSERSPNGQIERLTFNGATPVSVTVRNTPYKAEQRVKRDLGIFVQDAWTMRRLTINYGGRYDHFNAEVPAQYSPPVAWVPFERDFKAIENVPNWHDWSIRLAGSYDLFGTGKTALKVNASKYVASEAAGFAAGFNPMGSQSSTRGWNDADGNKSILDAAGNIQYNEVAAGASNFGTFTGTTRPDEDLARGYNWEHSVSVQHELFPRVSVTGGYYRRKYYNLRVSDNLNLSPSEYNEFTITGPSDDRFPNKGGEVITMYSLNANKLGTPTDTLSTFSSVNTRVYDGIELSVNARTNRALFFGGITTERTAATDCDVRDNPNSFRFCDNIPPFRTILKASASYELPYDIQLSGSYSGRPGSSVSANYPVTSALAGRTIYGNTGGTQSITVNLIEPNTLFLDYVNQVDGRVARNFRFSRYRVQGFVDIFNILNAGTVLAVNSAYGSNPATRTWMNPTAIMTGRTIRFGGQMSF